MNAHPTRKHLKQIKSLLTMYLRLPLHTGTIPGSFLENAVAKVYDGKALPTYDFVDVIGTVSGKKVGWQVKSTKSSTPVTWKRAKLPNASGTIERSRHNSRNTQELGNQIIAFCNNHAKQSIESYKLDEIWYARLIVKKDSVIYFEKLLCTSEETKIFEPNDFSWEWGEPKATKKKEQLPALHGFHIETKKKWWAWHGLGENQLHFTGEKNWWPNSQSPHSIAFQIPSEEDRISDDQLMKLLETYFSDS